MLPRDNDNQNCNVFFRYVRNYVAIIQNKKKLATGNIFGTFLQNCLHVYVFKIIIYLFILKSVVNNMLW